MKDSLKWALALTVFTACQPQPLPTGQSEATAPVVQHLRVATPSEAAASGQVSVDGPQVTLSLTLYPKPEGDFKTQLLDLGATTKLHATLTDSHGKTYTPVGADGNGAVNYGGGTINLTFNNVTPNPLIIAEVEARVGTTPIPQTQLATALAYSGTAAPPATRINFQTTVAARALKTLLASNAPRARAINLNNLNSLTASITGVSGTAPNFTYSQNHPSLVNTTALAGDLVGSNPGALTASAYRQNGATIPLNVSGLSGGDRIQVQITDAASAVSTNLGNGTSSITAATPGNGLSVKVSPFGAPGQTYNYAFPATINLVAGSNPTLNVVATPTLQVNSLNPTSGQAGASITISGTGFTGITAPNGVAFNGVNATYTVVNDTTITATVPSTAVDGPITVTKGAVSQNSSSFNVIRRIYVNDNASGSNDGTSWANAYTDLQVAIAASGAQDEIWIAAGTYKPHTSDRNTAFSLKSNVNVYGGFSGSETQVSQRNILANPTILSGDFNNDDDYSSFPFSNISENARTIVKSSGTTYLDGVVIQGGNSELTSGAESTSGGGIYTSGGTMTLKNATVTHNTAAVRGGGAAHLGAANYENVSLIENHGTVGTGIRGRGGGIYSDALLNLNHVRFIGNQAGSGGGLRSLNGEGTFENVVFDSNLAETGGGGLHLQSSARTETFTVRNATFINNRAETPGASSSGVGGAIYNLGSTLNVENCVFSGNSAEQRGVSYNQDATLTYTHCTFSNNTSDSLNEEFSNAFGGTTLFQNSLFWQTRPHQALAAGNVSATTDPFVNSANPLGTDGTARSADDGLRITTGATEVIDQGTDGVLATDILGNTRVSNPEPGAYEFIP